MFFLYLFFLYAVRIFYDSLQKSVLFAASVIKRSYSMRSFCYIRSFRSFLRFRFSFHTIAYCVRLVLLFFFTFPITTFQVVFFIGKKSSLSLFCAGAHCCCGSGNSLYFTAFQAVFFSGFPSSQTRKKSIFYYVCSLVLAACGFCKPHSRPHALHAFPQHPPALLVHHKKLKFHFITFLLFILLCGAWGCLGFRFFHSPAPQPHQRPRFCPFFSCCSRLLGSCYRFILLVFSML